MIFSGNLKQRPAPNFSPEDLTKGLSVFSWVLIKILQLLLLLLIIITTKTTTDTLVGAFVGLCFLSLPEMLLLKDTLIKHLIVVLEGRTIYIII